MSVSAAPDALDARHALGARGALGEFNAAGVLGPADVHVARRLAALAGEEREEVLLAAALAVRGPRLGHVCTDLSTLRETAAVDADLPVDVRALPWPEPVPWLRSLARSPLVVVGEDGGDARPLRLIGPRIYLDRYWRDERGVAAELRGRAEAEVEGVDLEVLANGLDREFPREGEELQRLAAACAVLRRLAVVAGGPGTGKTTTVGRILALIDDQARASGAPAPLVALAAPTGKAAARLAEAVERDAATLHRLLGSRPDSRSRFRHGPRNPLPHDVVVVDETSMVPLSLMARLLEAVRPGARLVLVGDSEQLASVEAGAVLGDIVGPAADGLLMRAPARMRVRRATGADPPAAEPPPDVGLGDGVVVLRRVHRFGGAIAALAEAVRAGDADAALRTLGADREALSWVDVGLAPRPGAAALAPVRRAVLAAGRDVHDAARAGRAREALEALGAFRLLCAHRRGPYGVAAWTDRIEGWLGSAVDGYASEGAWYVGRPLLVTENDYGLRLFNGDTGVVIADGDGVAAAFDRGGEQLRLGPARLEAVETVHAMTVHKSQGSQFDAAVVVLPEPSSPILTRELLYTAVTRARERLILVCAEASLRTAVARPVARASGLRDRLWSPSPASAAG